MVASVELWLSYHLCANEEILMHMHKISRYYRVTKGNEVRIVCIMIGIYCAQRHYEVKKNCTWWRHEMETFSALLAICAGNSPVPGEFPAQRPATRSFGVFFDLHLNKRLSKQSWGWWFETLSRPLWRHRNENIWHGFMFRGKTFAENRQNSIFICDKKSSDEKQINTNWSELSDRSNLILQQ